MNKDLEVTEVVIEDEPDQVVKTKETKKKFTVGLVTNTSIIYDDHGVSRFISKKGFEDLKIGDTFKI